MTAVTIEIAARRIRNVSESIMRNDEVNGLLVRLLYLFARLEPERVRKLETTQLKAPCFYHRKRECRA